MRTARPFRGRKARHALVLASCLAASALVAPLASYAATPLIPAVAPLPSGADTIPQAYLNGVVCTSSTQCVAVGRYQAHSGGGKALIISRSGGSWGSAHSVTLPANAANPADATLNAVACRSFGNCTAVGSYGVAGGRAAMIVVEHSGTWSAAFRSPLPGGWVLSGVTALNAVHCTSVANCIAVGQFTKASGNQGFIVHSSGGVWGHALTAPLPVRAKSNFITQLDGVTCTTAGNCTAVGQYVNTDPAREAMILTEVSGAWVSSKKVELPTNAHRDPWAGLFSITCSSVGYCTSVGVYQGPHGGQGLISVEAGGVWRRGIAAPLPPGQSVINRSVQLLSVTCTSFGNCRAVGQDSAGLVDYGVMETEKSGHWGAVVTPRPVDASSPIYNVLNAISCASTARCQMVGEYQAHLGQPALTISL